MEQIPKSIVWTSLTILFGNDCPSVINWLEKTLYFVGVLNREKQEFEKEDVMRKYFKVAYWIFIYVFILTGCSNNHGAEEKIAVEDGKEGQVEEKIEGAVIESGNDIIKAGTEYSAKGIVMESEIVDADWSDYSEETLNELKQVMLVSEQERSDIPIYGKTGMGKAEGVVVDAWFTGFAEGTEGKIYFCVHLGRTDGMNVSSSRAKKIAIQIVSDYYGQ